MMRRTYRLAELAEAIGGVLAGPADLPIHGVGGLEAAGPGEISFVADAKQRAAAQQSRAAALIVSHDFEPTGRPLVRVDRPRLAFARVLELFALPVEAPPGIHPTAVIEPGAALGAGVSVQAHAYIGRNARIGENCVLHPGVYIGEEAAIGAGTHIHANAVIRERVQVGRNCLIHSGAVLGSDGFGFVPDGARQRKVPQIGTVIIEDDVEIGANATIDRATVGATIVHGGTKIDNLVQIGHNVIIGSDCLVCAMTGIAGSAVIEDEVILAGQVGVKDHARIGRGSRVAARSLVARNLPSGSFVSGDPARPHAVHLKALAAAQRVPGLVERVAELERRLTALEKSAPAG